MKACAGSCFLLAVCCFGCVGTFVNPIVDVAWNCLFPITIGGVFFNDDGQTPQEDVGFVCMCKKRHIPDFGVPIGFWEPAFLVDVTRRSFCFVGLGGLSLGRSENSCGAYKQGEGKQAFYHVHVYRYPLLEIFDVLGALGCLEGKSMDIVYLSEFDILWGDDELARFVNLETVAIDHPMAQLACGADCVAANVGLPLEKLYWCGGCLGSVFPLAGTVSGVGSDVQASALLVHRALFKLHRMGLLKGTLGKEGLCAPYTMLHMRKHQYKTQMVFPVGQRSACQPLGRSEVLWGLNRSFPVRGEDFCYLVWRRRDCCVLGGHIGAPMMFD